MNDINICNAALLKLGVSPITDFGGGTVESFTAATLYPIVKKAVLSSHYWSFATYRRRLRALARNSEDEAAEPSTTHYSLPSDFLRAVQLEDESGHNITHYEIRDTELIVRHQDGVWLKYVALADEANFPPYFTQALIARIAAEFCLPITDSTSRMESLYRLSELELQKARSIDSRQEPPQRLQDNSLLGARG